MFAAYTGLGIAGPSQLPVYAAFGLNRPSAHPVPNPLPVSLVLYPRGALRSLHPLSTAEAAAATDAEMKTGTAVVSGRGMQRERERGKGGGGRVLFRATSHSYCLSCSCCVYYYEFFYFTPLLAV